VLRCARCGRFVDWTDSRLQTVCQCRPRIDLPPVYVRGAEPADADATLELFQRDFRRAEVLAFGEMLALAALPAIVAEMKGEVAGALAYRRLPDALHIVALATDPMWQRSGVGGYLVAEIELMARKLSVPRVIFCTTNDNLPSLYFYQRRGYRITEVVPGALLPHVTPAFASGFAGIPVRDEIRLEKTF
jgi:N-acetylglutamate synthase-like GNAT family acetyltransferase